MSPNNSEPRNWIKWEGKLKNPKKRKSIRGKKKQYVPPEFTNPWPYVDTLPTMSEALKLDRKSLSELECQREYIIKSDIEFDNNSDDQIYRLFGELISKEPGFMRQWVRLFAIMHRGYIEKLAKDYLANSKLSLVDWCKCVKTGDRADVLVLFVLSYSLLCSPKARILDLIEE